MSSYTRSFRRRQQREKLAIVGTYNRSRGRGTPLPRYVKWPVVVIAKNGRFLPEDTVKATRAQYPQILKAFAEQAHKKRAKPERKITVFQSMHRRFQEAVAR